MKYLLSVFLLFVTTSLLAETKSITIDSGQPSFSVSLQANPTTGFRWEVKEYNKQLFQLVNSQFIAPKTTLVGAPGVQQFHFKLQPGHDYPQGTTMVFEYKRPWEKDKGSLKTVKLNFKQNCTCAEDSILFE